MTYPAGKQPCSYPRNIFSRHFCMKYLNCTSRNILSNCIINQKRVICTNLEMYRLHHIQIHVCWILAVFWGQGTKIAGHQANGRGLNEKVIKKVHFQSLNHAKPTCRVAEGVRKIGPTPSMLMYSPSAARGAPYA